MTMEWTQFILLLITIAGLFIWNRTESRSDARHMDAKLQANTNLIIAIHEEMKDFHGRLCEIEEKKGNDNGMDASMHDSRLHNRCLLDDA
jgi:hypothetical protein